MSDTNQFTDRLFDFARVERGLDLHAERVGDRRYYVTGGATGHWVDLTTSGDVRCDCGDYIWRDEVCKHIVAALLREGSPSVLRAVSDLVKLLKTSRSLNFIQAPSTSA